MTKRLMADQIWYRLSEGYPTVAEDVQIEDIYQAIGQKINEKFKYNQLAINLPSGETIPDGLCLATYANVPVVSLLNKKSKAVLPIIPISLPRNMGVYDITASILEDSINPNTIVKPTLGVSFTTVIIDNFTAPINSSDNIIYAVKVYNQTNSTVLINTISLTLTGTFVSGDIDVGGSGVSVYSNTSVSLSGAVSLFDGNAATPPATISDPFLSVSINGGDYVYIIVSINLGAGATTGHQVTLNGATNPMQFIFTGTVTQINNQANYGAVLTIGT